MGWVIALIVLAVIFGVVGLVVEAVKWFLIIAGVLLLAGVARGFVAGRRSTVD
jgi:hypothetical protein